MDAFLDVTFRSRQIIAFQPLTSEDEIEGASQE